MDYRNCELCPRRCAVDRTAGERGWCGGPDTAVVAKTMIHRWEEPALAPNGKSGAVFFGGCTLGCIYCQNRAISCFPVGTPMDSRELRNVFENLIAEGAENIDLVTPTHYLPTILPALEPKLHIPVVYNCGGYERVETLREYKDYIDIYLPDLKYYDSSLSEKYSAAKDYFSVASKAIEEMIRLTGGLTWDPEQPTLLKKGVVIRHMVLPGAKNDSIRLLHWMKDNLPEGQYMLSLMSQYTPFHKSHLYPEINRRITSYEYNKVLDTAIALALVHGYMQEKSSAKEEYTPPFDLSGV